MPDYTLDCGCKITILPGQTVVTCEEHRNTEEIDLRLPTPAAPTMSCCGGIRPIDFDGEGPCPTCGAN